MNFPLEYLTSIISFFNNDIKKADHNIESMRVLKTLCEDINTIVLRQETADAIALGYINESVKRAGDMWLIFLKNVINYLVEEDRLTQEKEIENIGRAVYCTARMAFILSEVTFGSVGIGHHSIGKVLLREV